MTHPALSVPLELHEWAFMNQWLLQQAAARRTPVSARDYEEIVAALDPTIKAVAIDLHFDTTLISTDQAGIGHVVIVTRQGTRPPQLWDIAANLPAQAPEVEQPGCWRPMAGTRPCHAQEIGLLPNDASGTQRFYIEAGYAQVAGATTGHQLSLWRWNGGVATPLYVTSFTGIVDAPQEGVHVDGDTIRIVQKDQWRVLDPCGACECAANSYPKRRCNAGCFRVYYGIRSRSMTATLFTFARRGSELRIVDAQQHAAGCVPE